MGWCRRNGSRRACWRTGSSQSVKPGKLRVRFAEPALVAAVRRLMAELDQAGNHETLHTPSEPASKKRQGSKSRELGTRWQRVLWRVSFQMAARSRNSTSDNHCAISR